MAQPPFRLRALSVFTRSFSKGVKRLFDDTAAALGPHGATISVWPYDANENRSSADSFLYTYDPVRSENTGLVLAMRNLVASRFPSQVAVMVPVIFTTLAKARVEVVRDGVRTTQEITPTGVTISGAGVPNFILVDPDTAVGSTIAHEMGHAAGLPDNQVRKGNKMYKSTDRDGAALDAAQLSAYRSAYFAGAA